MDAKKIVSLHDVHGFIEDVREIAFSETEESMLSGEEVAIEVSAEEMFDLNYADILKTQKELQELIDHIAKFDADFHDRFDCQ